MVDTFGLPPEGAPSLEDVQAQLDSQARRIVPVLQSVMGQADAAGQDMAARQAKVVNRIGNSIRGSLRRSGSVIGQIAGELSAPVFGGLETANQKIGGAMSDPAIAQFVAAMPGGASNYAPPPLVDECPPGWERGPSPGTCCRPADPLMGIRELCVPAAEAWAIYNSSSPPPPPSPPPPLPPPPPNFLPAPPAPPPPPLLPPAFLPPPPIPPCDGARGPYQTPPEMADSDWFTVVHTDAGYWLCPPAAPPAPPAPPPASSAADCPQTYTIIQGPPCPQYAAMPGSPAGWTVAGLQLPPGWSIIQTMTDTAANVQAAVNSLAAKCAAATIPAPPPAAQS